MAAMATYPPLTPPCDLPVWLLPNNIFPDADELETTNLLEQYFFYDDCIPPDFSAITDIPMAHGVERFNEHTDLSAIELNPFQTPPTPEPESSPIPKPEVIETRIKQETSNDVVGFGFEEDKKLTYGGNEFPSPEEMPQQQQQQPQEQQKFQG